MPRRFLPLLALALCLCSNLRAEWIELPWPALKTTLPIWKPEDFDPAKTYPAIVWYPGTGGEPNADFIHRVTGGKDFVIVGMTYREPGASQYSGAEISDSLGVLSALKKTLTGSLSVDPKRIYVGGFSKGGWQSAMLVERDRDLAGAIVTGGGVLEKRPDAEKFAKPVPIYVASGRFDGNYPQILGALNYFRGLGADVTLETWDGLAHQIPQETPETLRQWLRLQAAPADLTAEAKTWIETRLPQIAAVPDPIDRWLAYDGFLQFPFVKRFGVGAARTVQAEIARLLENTTVAAESKWRGESRKLLALESRDRLLNTLTAASEGYAKLAEAAKGTREGEIAVRDLARTLELLKTAHIVTRPGDPAPEPLTPEIDPGTFGPTSPGGTDRGPFFPPKMRR